jgi:oxygen-independent coproporphyrinogen III oxidase
MAGIYLHIPFCKQACVYCNFYFSTSMKNKNDIVAALLKESEMRRNYLAHEPVETIYFGGGTPSLLTAEELLRVMEKLRQTFEVTPDAEITWEANPDDISSRTLKAWKKAGVNRLSIGIQSFFEQDLRWMNRAHDAQQAQDSIHACKEEGFNLTIDLIYGTPSLSDGNWIKNLELSVALDIPHLSCYALTVEPGTALYKKMLLQEGPSIDSADQARQFTLMVASLQSAGYDHYEISNFARPGKRSRHNTGYWLGKPYLGLGPSAHSYNRTSRQWNVSSNRRYLDSLAKGELPFEKEELTPVQMLNEYLMVSLRMAEGINLDYFKTAFGEQATASLNRQCEPYIQRGRMILSDGRLKLTEAGKLFADGIAADLFFEFLGERI